MCFVNTHLAAHKGNVVGRNADYHNICRRAQFGDEFTRPSKINDHHQMFWLGDLNYRLNFSDLDHVFKLVEEGNIKQLLEQDQLMEEKAKQPVAGAFGEWQEGEITFLPTYKYQPGTNDYERREEKKRRFPAWPDRIQWKGEDITLLSYDRAELLNSDHRPVMAVFEVQAQKVVKKRKQAVRTELVQQLDGWENELLPKVEMEHPKAFPALSFDEPFTQTFRVSNVGQVLVNFLFVTKNNEEAFCRPWLTCVPDHGIIVPAQHVDIQLTIHVKRDTSHHLNTGQDKLEDVLVLHLQSGGDHFVEIKGEYEASCFGASLAHLVSIRAPVRCQPTVENRSFPKPRIPPQVWRMVDYIFKNGMDTEGLFDQELHPAIPEEIATIRESLDIGVEFAGCSVHAMASAFLMFLASLHRPVFPWQYCEELEEDNVHLTKFCRAALHKLRQCNFNTFVYIIAFLREVLRHKAQNKLTAIRLMLIFSDCLTHAPQNQASSSAKEPKSWRILNHFITSPDFI